MGIEPTYEAWEAAVLPLNYTRSVQAVIIERFRPMALHDAGQIDPQAWRASHSTQASSTGVARAAASGYGSLASRATASWRPPRVRT